MTFVPGSDDLRCADCDAEITRAQYQRKIPRCDRCEGDVWQAALDAQLDGWNRAAFDGREAA